ncbi:MAG: ATP-binding cassette domain-containing protein, partial [Desulfosarcinaceae bacterium]
RAAGFLGRDLSLVDTQADRTRARNILSSLDLTLDPDLHPSRLSVSMRQFVEIAREMDKRDLKLLLLDEPTAVLNQADADRLLAMLRRAADSGTAVVYVSHRLDEITALCDNTTVLRDGRVAGRFPRGCRHEHLAEAMVGGDIVKARKRKPANGSEALLSLRGFKVDMPGESLAGIDLDIRQGEILGLAGLSGHGKLALAMGVMGLHPFSGELRLGGEQLAATTPSGMINRGVYYLPEDRRTMGLLPAHSVMENMVLPAAWNSGRFLRRIPFTGLALLHRKACETYARQNLEQLQIKCMSIHQRVDQLSGGNQQKVVIAQSLAGRPRILLVSEPTRGVDLQAKERILDILMSINQEQATTLIMASSDLDELHRTCDRVAVIHKGRLAAMLDTGTPEREFALAFSAALGNALQ